MKLPASILRGYDKVTEKYVADALGMDVPKRKKKKKHKVKHVRGKRS